MTLGEILTQVDTLNPNAVDAQYKRGWINECERMAIDEVISTHAASAAEKAAAEAYAPYTAETPDGTELLVPEPYCSLYRWYLEGQIALVNLETERYGNMMQLYNAICLSYKNYYNRTHAPLHSAQGALL